MNLRLEEGHCCKFWCVYVCRIFLNLGLSREVRGTLCNECTVQVLTPVKPTD